MQGFLGSEGAAVGDETVAAISSSGAPGPTSDEPCAQAGIDAIKDRLR